MGSIFTYTQWFTEFDFGKTYIVSEAVRPDHPSFSDDLMDAIEIGDALSFHEPKNAFCKIVRNGLIIANCPTTFLPSMFCLEGHPALYPDYMMYRISLPEDARAIMSGVPTEDVYV